MTDGKKKRNREADEGGGGRLEYRVEIWGEPPASMHICVTFPNKQTNKQPGNKPNRTQHRRRHLLICSPVRDAGCCGDGDTRAHCVSVRWTQKHAKKKGVKQIISLTDGLNETTRMRSEDAHTCASTRWGACAALPELVAERGDLSCHALAAVAQFLQLPLQLPSLGVGAGVLLLHLLQLPLQLLQTHHRLIQLGQEG